MSLQNKGLLLAKLLQKAVQNKNKKSIQQNKQQCKAIYEQQNYRIPIKQQQQQQIKSTQRQKLTSTPSTLVNNSRLSGSKVFRSDQINSSFEDSLLIQPSYFTNNYEQLNQMVKYIYIEVFSQQKYQLDYRRYEDIQIHPEMYINNNNENINIKQFNKQGKLLENAIFEIRQQKEKSKQKDNQIQQMNRQISKLNECINIIQKQLQFKQRQIKQYNLSGNQNKICQSSTSFNESHYHQIQHQNIELFQTIQNLQSQLLSFQQNFLSLQNQHKLLLQQHNTSMTKKSIIIKQLQQIVDQREQDIKNLLLTIEDVEEQLNRIKKYVEMQQKIQQKYIQQMEDKLKIKQIQLKQNIIKSKLTNHNDQYTQTLIQQYQYHQVLIQTQQQSVQKLRYLTTYQQIQTQTQVIKFQQQHKIQQNKSQSDGLIKLNYSNSSYSQSLLISQITISHRPQQNNIDQINQQKIQQMAASRNFYVQKIYVQNQTQTIHQISNSDKQIQKYQQQISQHQQKQNQKQHLVFQLRKLLTYKQKNILNYQKQLEQNQIQIQKYQSIIKQLCQDVQAYKNKISLLEEQIYTIQNIQTTDKSIQVIIKQHSNTDNTVINNQIKQQCNFTHLIHKQIQAQKIISNSQLLKIQQFSNLSSSFIISKPYFTQNQLQNKQTHFQDLSFTLSQFSQPEQIKDIRRLTRQLSQAYDKIIALTYEVQKLKKQKQQKLINQHGHNKKMEANYFKILKNK